MLVLLAISLTFSPLILETLQQDPISESDVVARSERAGEDSRHRPSVVTFVTDLAQNSAALISDDNVVPLVVGLGSIAATRPADGNVRDYFAASHRLGGLTEIGDTAGSTAVMLGAVGGVWVFSHFYGTGRFFRFSHDLAQASALNALLTQGIKHAVGRTRPDGTNDVSMPSGHSSSAFAVAAVADSYLGTIPSVLAYTGASVVAASRLDSNRHYLSDVVAGAALGYIVARTVTRRTQSRTRLSWTPIVLPETSTLGVAVSWSFDSD